MSINKVAFDDRADGTYAVWETPYGHQEVNISLRRFVIAEGKIKVILGEVTELPYINDVTRVINTEDFSFKFKCLQVYLTSEEKEEVIALMPAAKEEKARLAFQKEKERAYRRKKFDEYSRSKEYKEKLIKDLKATRNREQEILRKLEKFGYKED